ncbi:MAG: sigma-70 family RNA polymerase sigma factor [Corynebacterium sp.]|nr:sigma-70 family RNA polymerase sigma factor [Corynebacterium sp.]
MAVPQGLGVGHMGQQVPCREAGWKGAAEEARGDSQLVDDFLEGDIKAFSEIVDRHKRRLHQVARSYVSQPTDAEDVVQEALLRASQSLHTYRAEAQLATWLIRLVRNVGYDWAGHRSNAVHDSVETIHDLANNPTLAHSPHHNVDAALDMDKALASIPAEYGRTLFLMVVGGYSINDLAHAFGIAPGTVKSRCARAKHLLKDAIA